MIVYKHKMKLLTFHTLVLPHPLVRKISEPPPLSLLTHPQSARKITVKIPKTVNSKSDISHIMAKPTKLSVCPAKTQISLGICPVWSVFTVRSMDSWGPYVSSCRQRRLIRLEGCPGWSEFTRTCHFVGFVMRRLIYCSVIIMWCCL